MKKLIKLNMQIKESIGMLLSIFFCSNSNAATWSDTFVTYRYGNNFSEPFKNNIDGSKVDISKNIFSLTHLNGYKYGTNYVKSDFLYSSDEPNARSGSREGTSEAYFIYRNTFDIGKFLNKDIGVKDIIKGYGLITGVDVNVKNDVYSSRKQLFAIGPTIMFDVPGFLNFNTLVFFESNTSSLVNSRYKYDPRLALQLVWGMPIKSTPLTFEGFILWSDSKGINESGNKTVEETNIDVMVMYDISQLFGLGKKKMKIGAEYQYWENKFGNSDMNNKGATSSTPMIRMEYKF